MELTSVIGFVVMATLLVISPGPNGLLIAKSVYAAGRRAGFANILGFVLAFYVHGTLAIFGISMLLVQSAQAYLIFKLCGATYLLWLGLRSLLEVWRGDVVASRTQPNHSVAGHRLQGAVLEGFLTNALNPKVSIFYLAAFPQFLPLDSGATVAYLLVSTHVLINLFWFSCMVLVLSQVDFVATRQWLRRSLKSVTGIVFIAFGIKLLILKPIESD